MGSSSRYTVYVQPAVVRGLRKVARELVPRSLRQRVAGDSDFAWAHTDCFTWSMTVPARLSFIVSDTGETSTAER